MAAPCSFARLLTVSSLLGACADVFDPALLAGKTLYVLVHGPIGPEGYACVKIHVGKSAQLMSSGVLPPPSFDNDMCKLLWQSDYSLGAYASFEDGVQLYSSGTKNALKCRTQHQDYQLKLRMSVDEQGSGLRSELAQPVACGVELRLTGPLSAFGLQSLDGAQPCRCGSGELGTKGFGGGCYHAGVLCEASPGTVSPAGPSTTPLPGSLTTPASTAGADGYLESVYRRGRCISVGESLQLFAGLCRWGSADQKWRLRHDGLIESVRQPGKCIDVDGNPGISNASKIQLHQCELGWKVTDQAWDLRADGLLESRVARGMCMDPSGSPMPWADVPLQLWSCDTGRQSDMRWMVAQTAGEAEPHSVLAAGGNVGGSGAAASAAGPGEHTTAAPQSGSKVCFLENVLARGKCVGVKQGGAAFQDEGQALQLSVCEFGKVDTLSRWKLRSDGFIENMEAPGSCIDVRGNHGVGSPPANGDALQLRTCEFGWGADVTDQRWQLRSDGLLENRLSPGKCIDVDGYPGTQVGLQLQIWDCANAEQDADLRWTCSEQEHQALPVDVKTAMAEVSEKYLVVDDDPRNRSRSVAVAPVLVLGLPLSLVALFLLVPARFHRRAAGASGRCHCIDLEESGVDGVSAQTTVSATSYAAIAQDAA